MPIYKPCGPSDEDRGGKDEYSDFVEKKDHKGRVIFAVMVIDATCEDGVGGAVILAIMALLGPGEG